MKTNKYSIQFDPMPGWGLEGFTAVPCSIILTYRYVSRCISIDLSVSSYSCGTYRGHLDIHF